MILKLMLMRTGPALFFVLLMFLTCCGCISGGQPSPTPTATATATPAPSLAPSIYIGGVVLDQAGAPIPNARIALWQGPGLVRMPDNPRYTGDGNTALKGTFNFTDLPPGQYQLSADVQGHKAEADQRFDSSTNIEMVIKDYRVSGATPAPSQGPLAPGLPYFKVTRTGPTSLEAHLVSFGANTTSLRGFYVKSPAITTQEVIPVDKSITEDQTILITDPKLSGTVNFVASSWVNGNYAEVANTTV